MTEYILHPEQCPRSPVHPLSRLHTAGSFRVHSAAACSGPPTPSLLLPPHHSAPYSVLVTADSPASSMGPGT